MSIQKTDSSPWESQNAKNTVKLGLWTGAWVLTTAIVAFAPKFIWDFATIPTVIAVLSNLAIGFGMIFANIRHFNGLDEMQQKIFFNSAAITLGVAIVCGCSYASLKNVQLITFEPDISHLIILMGLTFLCVNAIGHWKYK